MSDTVSLTPSESFIASLQHSEATVPSYTSHTSSREHSPSQPVSPAANQYANQGASTNSNPSSSSFSKRMPVSGDVSVIHHSYTQQIRNLQKTNNQLTKKVEQLQYIQNDNVKIKMIQKLQRLLKEKQYLMDEVVEMLINKGCITPEQLSAHLSALIDRGAFEQSNPAKHLVSVQHLQKENNKLLQENIKLKKIVRHMESTGPLANNAQPTPPPLPPPPANAQQQQSPTSTPEYVALQSKYHASLVLLQQQKELMSEIVRENRELRARLRESDEYEQQRVAEEKLEESKAIQHEKEKAIQSQEHLYQVLRIYKHNLLQLTENYRKNIHDKNEEIRHLQSQHKQLESKHQKAEEIIHAYKLDLKNIQQVLSQYKARVERYEEIALHDTHEQELSNLSAQLATLTARIAFLSSSTPSNAHPYVQEVLKREENMKQRMTQVEAWAVDTKRTLEQENAQLLDAKQSIEQSLQAQLDNLYKSQQEETAITQTTINAMATDLANAQNELTTLKGQFDKAINKIQKLKAQRQALSTACTKQNMVIMELNKEMDLLRVSEKHDKQARRKRRNEATSGSNTERTATDSSLLTDRPRYTEETSKQEQEPRLIKSQPNSPRVNNEAPTQATTYTEAYAPADNDATSAYAPVGEASDGASSCVYPTGFYDPTNTWQEYPTEDGTGVFYYNNITGESTWEVPNIENNHHVNNEQSTDAYAPISSSYDAYPGAVPSLHLPLPTSAAAQSSSLASSPRLDLDSNFGDLGIDNLPDLTHRSQLASNRSKLDANINNNNNNFNHQDHINSQPVQNASNQPQTTETDYEINEEEFAAQDEEYF